MVVQTIEGIVTKAGVMAKTVTVTVERRLIHPKLLKVSLYTSCHSSIGTLWSHKVVTLVVSCRLASSSS